MSGLVTVKRSSPRKLSQRRGNSASLSALLERDLRNGRWRDGDRLPTERELSAHYQVARNTIRRALAGLEESKLIVRQVGRGTYKASSVPGERIDPFEVVSVEQFSPSDVVECRLIFEPGLASLAVARATKADLDRMAECLRNAESSTTLAEFEQWDAALHDAIAAATHNQAVISMSRSLAKVRQQAQWGTLKARNMTPQRKAKLHAEHRAIVAAFSRRDHSKAHSMLRKHLLHVRSYMFGE